MVYCDQVLEYLTEPGSTWHVVSGTTPLVLPAGSQVVSWAVGSSSPPSAQQNGNLGAYVAVGDACPSSPVSSGVVMSVADYEQLRTAIPQVTTSDVSAFVAPIALCWAVAWLCKRALRVLIPNA